MREKYKTFDSTLSKDLKFLRLKLRDYQTSIPLTISKFPCIDCFVYQLLNLRL